MKTSIAALALSLFAVMPAPAQTDYETVPPDPAETAQKLAAAPVTMAKAIELAASATGGRVLSAAAIANGDLVTYDITCGVGGIPQRVIVNGATGAVSTIKLTLADAIAGATKKVDGIVQSATGDFGAEAPTYTVVVLANNKFNTLVIDAGDGTVKSEEVRGQFPGVDAEGELVTTADGLQYIELVEGTGIAPSGPGAVVEVHYSGYLVDGTKFDSSVDRGAPTSFPLANVIPGWTKGVGSMKVGGKRKLVIPYALAYGANGRPPVIPAKATLIFDVELLRIVSNPDAPTAPPAPTDKVPTTK